MEKAALGSFVLKKANVLLYRGHILNFLCLSEVTFLFQQILENLWLVILVKSVKSIEREDINLGICF